MEKIGGKINPSNSHDSSASRTMSLVQMFNLAYTTCAQPGCIMSCLDTSRRDKLITNHYIPHMQRRSQVSLVGGLTEFQGGNKPQYYTGTYKMSRRAA